MDLFTRTQKLLADRPKGMTAKQISEATGLSRAWISRFGSGQIPRASAVMVQRLHDHLAEQLGQ